MASLKAASSLTYLYLYLYLYPSQVVARPLFTLFDIAQALLPGELAAVGSYRVKAKHFVAGPPGHLNSGLLVARPSVEVIGLGSGLGLGSGSGSGLGSGLGLGLGSGLGLGLGSGLGLGLGLGPLWR